MLHSPQFHYWNGILLAEDVDLRQIAADIGTPFYCYSTAALRRNYEAIANAFCGITSDAPLICYAMKANSNLAVLRVLAELGAGMDVVSEGELRRARAAGVNGDKILFSGVGKTAAEIRYALDENILSINVESEHEMRLISAIAVEKGLEAKIALRVNPDVDAHTHKKVSTGKAEDKFGVSINRAREILKQASSLPNLRITGVHIHIGSQITTIEPFELAIQKIVSLIGELREDGHPIEHIDVGGGLGISYHENGHHPPSVTEYAETIGRLTAGLKIKILLEPGRLIAGNAGVLVTEVLGLKQGQAKKFLIVDAAMNDLIRPTLYDSYHDIWPVVEAHSDCQQMLVDVVGPICETGDYLALNRKMPTTIKTGDFLAVMTTGAYGATMANTYNSRRLVPEVLVDERRWAVIRRRQTYEEQMALDTIPDWRCTGGE